MDVGAAGGARRQGGGVKKKPKAGTSKRAAEARRRLFVEAYIANGCNATEAAIAAGYSAKTAYRTGADIIKEPQVQQMLRERQEALAKKYELTTEAVIEKLAKLVHADLRRPYNADGSLKPPSEWPDDVAAAVVGFEAIEEFTGTGRDRQFVGIRKKVKMIEPTAALNLAMKHLGMFDKDNAQKGKAEAEALREFFRSIYGPGNRLPIARQ